MEVTLKPDLQKLCSSMVNYYPQKFRGLLAPTQYVSVTRLSPAFRVRVWLRKTTLLYGQSVSQKIDDLSVLATCQSDTSATLSSDVKGSVIHKSTHRGRQII